LVTGHGKLGSYFHRFGLTDNLICPGGGGGEGGGEGRRRINISMQEIM